MERGPREDERVVERDDTQQRMDELLALQQELALAVVRLWWANM